MFYCGVLVCCYCLYDICVCVGVIWDAIWWSVFFCCCLFFTVSIYFIWKGIYSSWHHFLQRRDWDNFSMLAIKSGLSWSEAGSLKRTRNLRNLLIELIELIELCFDLSQVTKCYQLQPKRLFSLKPLHGLGSSPLGPLVPLSPLDLLKLTDINGHQRTMA